MDEEKKNDTLFEKIALDLGFIDEKKLKEAKKFQKDLVVTEQWRLGGEHYAKTSNAWLSNLDLHQDEALAALVTVTDRDEARRALHRWRIFFMACAELFAYRDGREWGVSHYLLEPRNTK